MKRWFDRFFTWLNPWGDLAFGEKKRGKEFLRAWLVRLFHSAQAEFKIRYVPVIRELRRRGDCYATILEVGSGTMGLSRYTTKPITGVDLATTGPRLPNMTLLQADATALPFADKSFDLVVSMDMLEHMPAEARPKAIAQLLRVAGKKIFLAFPSGAAARKAEAGVYGKFQARIASWKGTPEALKVYRTRYWYLEEHAHFGLPERPEVEACLEACAARAAGWRWTVISNESVWVWRGAVTRTLYGNYFRWALMTLLYCLFFPLVARLTWPAPYRAMFILERE